jgi:AcrR family transcriptional regulator
VTTVQQRDPARTRAQILKAAIDEFSARGFSGARVNTIAARARANKRMLYHYFGNKEALYLAALEQVYATIREKERALDVEHLPPEEALRRLVELTWQHFVEHPEFIRMLNTENLHKAQFLARSKRIRELHSPLTQMRAELLARGAAAGVFRDDVDPVQLYVSIASLGYFYLSNRYTLSTIFGRDLGSEEALAERRRHIVEVILGFLRPDNGAAPAQSPSGSYSSSRGRGSVVARRGKVDEPI